jgi:hypothetical protein
LTATCGCDSNKEETPQVRVSARHLAAACAEGAYLVPMVEVGGARVAAAGDGLSGGEESVADRGERARAGGAGAETDFLRAGAEVPRGHASVRGGGREHQLLWRRRRRRHVQQRGVRVYEKKSRNSRAG